MIILGIETSCDETALALIETRSNEGLFEFRVINSMIHSQAELHSAYGGVYPNLAKREHGKNLIPLFKKLLDDSAIVTSKPNKVLIDEEYEKIITHFKDTLLAQNPELKESLTAADFLKTIPAIDKIAVTEGPGLEPALWTGITFAHMLSELWSIPAIPINHMEGHILGSLMESDAPYGTWQHLRKCEFPAISLLISGGHTEIVEMNSFGDYKIIGQTKDDAVGEAYDKVARLLELPYPGGPHISKMAQEAIQENIVSEIKLPRPMLQSKDLDFSFSGLKTAVLYAIRDEQKRIGEDQKISQEFKKGLAREFEEAVSETLEKKLRKAIDNTSAKTIIIGGGVSANFMLRGKFNDIGTEYGIPLYMPTRHISGDNALMIALVGALTKADGEKKILKANGTKRLGK